MRKINEECGVFGIYSPETQDVAHVAYYGLFALQHRGQESCGIVVNDDGVFSSHKDAGIVNDVFTPDTLERLGQGNMALGHVRYGTTGATGRRNAQPIVINHNKGTMAIAHNGNLVNSSELRAPSFTPRAIRRSSPISSPRSACPPLPSRRRSTAR